MRKCIFYIILFGQILVLAGCSNLSKNDSKKKITLRGKQFSLELADTNEKREKGLMYREQMNPDQGMLFIFTEKDYLQFWMQNTLIPLQVLMVDDCQIVDLIEMEKEKDPAHGERIYKSSKLANKAIELNSRTFDRSIIGEKIEELCK